MDSFPQLWPKTSIPIEAFRAIHWTGFALCFLAVSARTYIRLAVFRSLHIEDVLVIIALAILLATSVLCQLRIQDVYDVTAFASGDVQLTADFWETDVRSTNALLAYFVLTLVALWLVKANFLLFFRRLGSKVSRSYEISWWVITAVTMSCGVATFGINRWDCLHGDPDHILVYCSSPTELRASAVTQIAACVLDVFSDVLILILPFYIVWRVRLSRRKRIILCIIFSMTLLTVAMTITRGAFFHGIYVDTVATISNMTWIWFWYSIELIASIIISCLVSFRSLFVETQSPKSSKAQRLPQYQRSKSSTPKTPAREFYDIIMDACRTLEGNRGDDESFNLPEAPLGLMSVDFSKDEKWRKYIPRTGSDNGDSLHSLNRSDTV